MVARKNFSNWMRLVFHMTSSITNLTVNRKGLTRNKQLSGNTMKKRIVTDIQMGLSILLAILKLARQLQALNKKSRSIEVRILNLPLRRDGISTSIINCSNRKRANRFYLTKDAPSLPSARWMWSQSLVR